ncbi:hypothetical protein [Streptomyces sp. NPDC002537]
MSKVIGKSAAGVFSSAAAAAVFLSGCSTPSPAHSPEQSTPEHKAVTNPEVSKDLDTIARKGGNVPDLSLPIMSYRLSGNELAQVGQAKNSLVQQCMKELGFSDFKPAAAQLSGSGSDDLLELDDLRYGTYNAGQAAKTGYKPDFVASGRNKFANPPAEPERTDEEWLALTGTPKERSDGRQGLSAKPKLRSGLTVPEGGCLGESATKLTGGQQVIPNIVQRLNGESYRASMKDPRVKQAFGKWSECMKTKGYSYSDPMQANDDPRFASNVSSAEEIKTATADVACKTSVNLVGIWHSAEVDIQKQLIQKNSDALAQVKKSKESLLASATAASSKRP